MNATGWNLFESDSLVFYSRLYNITHKELLADQVIISRPKEKEKELKKIKVATKIILNTLHSTEIFQGLVVRRDCTVKIGKITATVIKVYVGNKDTNDDVLVTDKTIIQTMKPEILEIENAMEKLEIRDKSNHLSQIMDLIMYPIMYPKLMKKLNMDLSKGVLIHGPPGVGKTKLVLDLVQASNAKLVPIKLGIFTVEECQKSLIQGFEKARDLSKLGPCILFIDEIDALTPKRDKGQDSRIVAQLLTLMDGIEQRSQFIVIATTNRPNAIDSALRRPGRFDREIFIDVPQEAERLKLLESLTKKMDLSKTVDLPYIASITNGYVAADLVDVCREAVLASGHVKIDHQDFLKALGTSKGPSIKRGFQLSIEKLSWSDVAGLDDIRDLLIRNIEWPLKYPETYLRLGLRAPRGILLYGPPGCSKTTIAKILASTTKSSFYSLNGAQIFSAYVGESERTIRDLFSRARMSAPSIIFLDELEAIVGSRGIDGGVGSQDVSRDRVLSTLLNELDGIEAAKGILVIGATNRPDRIDAALMRPGRLDKTIFIGRPSVTGRFDILKLFTKEMPLSKSVDLSLIAEKTHLHTGADLKSLCCEAAFIAARRSNDEIEMEDFYAGMKVVSPTVSDEIEDLYSKKKY